jgi:type IX secretion system PorP/SprF family membrane protein
LYLENPYLLNPAYAGNNAYLNSSFVIRQTSASIPGAPAYYNLSVESPIYKSMSLGTRLISQSEGLFNVLSGYLDYAYKLKLSQHQSLSFGISAGFQSRQVKYSDIIAEDPNAIIEVVSKNYEGFSFETGAGMVYQINKLGVSLSIPQLFESKKNLGTDFRTLVTYQITPRNKDIMFKPAIFFNYNPNAPVLYDLNLTTYYKNQYFLGLAYRNSPGMIFSAGFMIKNLTLSYGIELSLKKQSSIFNQVHEISISYVFRQIKSQTHDNVSDTTLDFIAKKDTTKIKPDTAFVNVKNENDTLIVRYTDNKKPAYILQEAGKGIYVIKQLDSDATIIHTGQKNYITDEEMQNLDKDSLIASRLMMEMEKTRQDKNYEIIEVGDGLYSFRWKKEKNNDNNKEEFNDSMVDSVLMTDRIIPNLENNRQDTIADNIYTIQLLFDESNRSFLLDAEIALQTWFETDSNGKFLYFYGKFKTFDEASIDLSKLGKYPNIKSKIIKF